MIALDAMGGDFAPRETVLGAIKASQQGVPVCLFGDETQLIPLLDEYDSQWQKLPLMLSHCSQFIEMGAIPSLSVMKQQDSSLIRALNFVASGKGRAIVTAGNSGAALIAGTLILGKIDGLERPALGEFIPTEHGTLLCLDLGANTDCKPIYLYQFGVLGNAWVTMHKKIERPRIALLSNGTEPYKGSAPVKQAHALLEQSPLNFVGNVEARDVFQAPIDVLVCDGFAGNILLKSIQGTVNFAKKLLHNEINALPWWRKLLVAINKKSLEKVFKNADHHRFGAALLIGLNKPLFVAHGCATSVSIERALLKAHQLMQHASFDEYNARIKIDLSLQNRCDVSSTGEQAGI